MKRVIAILQKAGKYFLNALELVGAICAFVAVFTTVPPVIAVPIAVGIGILWGMVGGKKEADKADDQENQKSQGVYLMENVVGMKGDVQHLKDEVREGFQELKQDIISSHGNPTEVAVLVAIRPPAGTASEWENIHRFGAIMHDPLSQEFTLFKQENHPPAKKAANAALATEEYSAKAHV